MEPRQRSFFSTPSSHLIEQIRTTGLHPPENVTLMVTGACNLRCRHCWLECASLTGAQPVDTDKVTDVIDALARLGARRINLTGGEILSHPDWQPILRFCLDHAGFKGVCLQTNATLISHRHVRELLGLPPDKLTIQVSLDGACARTHDHVRGPGSFDRAINGLRLLVAAGYGPRIKVAFTEMAHNFEELPFLLKTIDDMGIARLISGTLIKGGRAAASSRVSLPTPAQYRRLIHRYQTDRQFHARYERKASIAAIEWFKNRSNASDENCGCLKDLFVDSRGRMFPCTMLLVEDYASESAYLRPMDQVFKKALEKWRDLPALHRKRRSELLSCSTCAGKNHCRGGCMGRAAASGQGLMGPEDRCSLRRAVYQETILPSGNALRGDD
jgi:radical SAM protein with 4Fe4S-binding SPASM domain